VLAFPDINPQAPVHVLVIPKQHIASLAQTKTEDAALLGHLLATAREIARQQGLVNGYRLVINTGADGGRQWSICIFTCSADGIWSGRLIRTIEREAAPHRRGCPSASNGSEPLRLPDRRCLHARGDCVPLGGNSENND
jgi:hypothetical protein